MNSNNTSNSNKINSNTTSNTNTTNSTSKNFERSNTNKEKTIVDKMEEIKKKGNELFKENKLKEACEKYYDVVNEMEYISDNNKFKKELEDLEATCRLNIANCKLKMEDYDIVIQECLRVLKKSESYKAHYRAGVAFFKKSKYSKAQYHLTKARELNKEEDMKQSK
jgi:tetratricopeptide (TPR) repeat protein